ncbi:MAG TPA: hypothetical protein EYG94_06485 [Campylobacterales bacterium]|nr:hypothetical protein [Campylobacterales bacterium]
MKNQVKKREVFYLSGYDPRGARYYYNLYKKEGAFQSKVNGLDLDFSSRKRTAKHVQSWEIKASSKEAETTTNYNFLEWDDVIRLEWKKSTLSLVLDLIFYVKAYLLSGAFRKYSKNFPYQMVSLFYPVVYISLVVIFSLVSGWFLFEWLEVKYSLLLSISLSFFLVNTLVYLALLVADKMALFWLLRIFVFSARYVYSENSRLEERIEYFSREIIKSLNKLETNETDEVLLVAHSVGAILMIPVLAKILKEIDSTIEISVLTLGECIPLVSVIPESTTFKEDMKYIAEQKNITLLDYGTLIDGACFPSLNYFTDISVDMPHKENFEFKSPRFHTLFSKNKYKEIRRNKYLAHFLYLMSSELKGEYDYFKMTAGHDFLKKEQK